MSMKKWAEREIELLKEANKPDEGECFDYVGGCCDSALKAFEVLLDDEHSGLSIQITKMILDKLIDGKALTPIEDDDEIKLAKSGGHSVIKNFKIAHATSALEVGMKFEGGDRVIKYITDNKGKVFDLPMIQTDAIYVIKVIMQDEALQGAELTFNSGTRVNDSRSWKSTGFAFVLDCDNKDSLITAIKNARKQTDCETLGPNSKKIKRHVFSYQDTDNGVAITVYPGKTGE